MTIKRSTRVKVHAKCVNTCNCAACKARRARVALWHKVGHSRTVHFAVFVLVASGMCVIAKMHFTEFSLGAVSLKSLELLGECVADRMFPPSILRDTDG